MPCECEGLYMCEECTDNQLKFMEARKQAGAPLYHKDGSLIEFDEYLNTNEEDQNEQDK